jgi:nucleoid-associated protein YgaU
MVKGDDTMKRKRFFLMLFSGFAIFSIATAHAYAQTSDAGSSGVIAPPSGGSETIAIPQTENVEVLPVPAQNSGTAQTAPAVQPQQPLENIPPLSGSTPTIEEQPLAPVSEGTAPGIPPENVSGELQTSTTLQPLSSPLPPMEQPPAVQQPSAELPAAPLTPMTTETMAPVTEAAPQTQPAQPPVTPESLQPQTEQLQAPPSLPPSAPQGAPAVTSLPEQNIPAPAVQAPAPETGEITRPPHIVPGEVLSGMPVYVNVRTTHIVKPGEDLHWLAAVYYGDARFWDKIYKANKNVIKDPNHLVVGTKLIIPPK